ncbi:MAG: hypothetical protein R8K53_04635 [Mariprofundaceae bacterium]
MKYTFIVSGLFAAILMSFTPQVSADIFSNSVEDRATAVRTQAGGMQSYNAYLAVELANIAESEVSDHDLSAAHEFIKMAEESAAKVRGK